MSRAFAALALGGLTLAGCYHDIRYEMSNGDAEPVHLVLYPEPPHASNKVKPNGTRVQQDTLTEAVSFTQAIQAYRNGGILAETRCEFELSDDEDAPRRFLATTEFLNGRLSPCVVEALD